MKAQNYIYFQFLTLYFSRKRFAVKLLARSLIKTFINLLGLFQSVQQIVTLVL